MNLTIEKKEYLEAKGITYLVHEEIAISNFEYNDEKIMGIIHVVIEYFCNSDTGTKKEERDLRFEIMKGKNTKVEEVIMDKYDFSVIDNQGVDLSYRLIVCATEIDVIEDIKDSIMDEVSSKLEEALDENERLEEIAIDKKEEDPKILENVEHEKENVIEPFLMDFDESYKSYKVIFVNDEKEIEEIACKYKKSVSEIYEENNFNIKNHLIIENIDENED